MIDAELMTMHQDMDKNSKHSVAWIFGSNEDKRSEVLQCEWNPKKTQQ